LADEREHIADEREHVADVGKQGFRWSPESRRRARRAKSNGSTRRRFANRPKSNGSGPRVSASRRS
jgi:hypothetical protein